MDNVSPTAIRVYDKRVQTIPDCPRKGAAMQGALLHFARPCDAGLR